MHFRMVEDIAYLQDGGGNMSNSRWYRSYRNENAKIYEVAK